MEIRGYRRREKGNTLLEFALIAPALVLILLGVVSVGYMLSRSIQVAQVTRDAAHMFFDGIDFSVVGNQNVVGRLGSGMGWTLASPDANGSTIDANGNGVVIFTKILMVGDNECTAGGHPRATTTCPNFGQLVIEQRIAIGNVTLRASNFGSPTQSLLQNDGSIQPQDYVTDSSVLVPTGTPPNNLNLAAGQFTYGVEAYFLMPSLARMMANNTYSYILM